MSQTSPRIRSTVLAAFPSCTRCICSWPKLEKATSNDPSRTSCRSLHKQSTQVQRVMKSTPPSGRIFPLEHWLVTWRVWLEMMVKLASSPLLYRGPACDVQNSPHQNYLLYFCKIPLNTNLYSHHPQHPFTLVGPSHFFALHSSLSPTSLLLI